MTDETSDPETPSMPARTARRDDRLIARVGPRLPMTYAGGADPTIDRPAHVRAASGVAHADGRLLVVQDDALFLAIVDPVTALAPVSDALDPGPGAVVPGLAIPLPSPDGVRLFDAIRGNKLAKIDLEACLWLPEDGWLLGVGSGSLPVRERILVVEDPFGRPRARVVDASALYARLRARPDFAGSELNLEGVARVGDRIVLFQRGNGAPRDGLLPVDATASLDLVALRRFLVEPGAPPPEPEDVTAWDLGDVGGVRLTFADAATRGDRLFYVASAEASPDAIADGEVVGAAIGVIDGGGARWAPLVGEDGRPIAEKAEGLVLDEPATSGGLVFDEPFLGWLVFDRDDPSSPSALARVTLEGPWLAG